MNKQRRVTRKVTPLSCKSYTMAKLPCLKIPQGKNPKQHQGGRKQLPPRQAEKNPPGSHEANSQKLSECLRLLQPVCSYFFHACSTVSSPPQQSNKAAFTEATSHQTSPRHVLTERQIFWKANFGGCPPRTYPAPLTCVARFPILFPPLGHTRTHAAPSAVCASVALFSCLGSSRAHPASPANRKRRSALTWITTATAARAAGRPDALQPLQRLNQRHRDKTFILKKFTRRVD